MKKLISFILIFIFLTSFSFVAFAEDGETVTDLEAIENIQEKHCFKNFVDIVEQYNYFCYFENSGTYYLAVFDVDGFADANQIRVMEDSKELYFWLGWNSVGLFATLENNLVFEEVSENYLLTGCFSNDDLKNKFDIFNGICNFDLNRGGSTIVSANFEDYKLSISESEPTTSIIPPNFSVMDSVVNCVTSAGENFISPLSTVFYTDNILTFLFLFVFILIVITLIVRSFLNARSR